MCQTRSGVAVYMGEDSVRLCLCDTDSHSEIRSHHNIRDDGGAGDRQTPLEYVPGADFCDLETWELIFDAGRPEWWTEAMTSSVIRDFRADLRPKIEKLLATGVWDGDLSLNCKLLPSGLSALTSIGGDADFRLLTDAAGLSALTSIGGGAFFQSLTDASGLSSLTSIGGYADFPLLTDADRASLLSRVKGTN